jgi:selenocysteine lyase/cysteine desulfurase
MTASGFVAGARRFDMGERDHFISLEMASIGMEMMARWGSGAVVARLRMLTDRLADGLADSGVQVADPRMRAPHILSLSFPHGMPERLTERLAAENVHVAARLGRIRISPHVYNDEVDADRFVATFRKMMA